MVDVTRELDRAIERIMGIEIQAMYGDNLAVTLCSYFDRDDGSEPNDNGWSQAATDAYDEIKQEIASLFVPVREAIAAWNTRTAPDGEPVAWMYSNADDLTPSVSSEQWREPEAQGWTETPLFAHPPRNDAVAEALRAKVAQLQEALVQHNERLRSAASIAQRDGRETNWLTFRGAVTYTLAEYRELVTECLDALKQGEPR